MRQWGIPKTKGELARPSIWLEWRELYFADEYGRINSNFKVRYHIITAMVRHDITFCCSSCRWRGRRFTPEKCVHKHHFLRYAIVYFLFLITIISTANSTPCSRNGGTAWDKVRVASLFGCSLSLLCVKWRASRWCFKLCPVFSESVSLTSSYLAFCWNYSQNARTRTRRQWQPPCQQQCSLCYILPPLPYNELTTEISSQAS